jgi:hypothetical protein
MFAVYLWNRTQTVWRAVPICIQRPAIMAKAFRGFTHYLQKNEGQDFSLLHVVQTGSGVHPTSYPMGKGGSFPGDKAAGA